MTNARESPADAAVPVEEMKVEKELEKEPKITTPEEPEFENGKNGNGHAVMLRKETVMPKMRLKIIQMPKMTRL